MTNTIKNFSKEVKTITRKKLEERFYFLLENFQKLDELCDYLERDSYVILTKDNSVIKRDLFLTEEDKEEYLNSQIYSDQYLLQKMKQFLNYKCVIKIADEKITLNLRDNILSQVKQIMKK